MANLFAECGIDGSRIEHRFHTGNRCCLIFWYDQQQGVFGEWVLLVQGVARLRFEDETIELKPGNFVNIPPHRKHRVEWTTPDEVITDWQKNRRRN